MNSEVTVIIPALNTIFKKVTQLMVFTASSNASIRLEEIRFDDKASRWLQQIATAQLLVASNNLSTA